MTDFDRDLDELIRREITRRKLLRGAGAGALSLSAAAFLAACGGGGGIEKTGANKQSDVIPKGQIAKTLNFSNWPLYIDVKGNRHPTLDEFQKKYGTKVKYTEEINDNTEFFGKVRQQYAAGNSGGRDLHVVTDWMAAKMIELGYVQKLDKSAMPNVVQNMTDVLRNSPIDRSRDYTVPWQSGQTGLIYRKDKVGTPQSINDIFDPKLKGKVTMLTEMRDTVGLVMLGMGKDPQSFQGLDDAMAAIEKIDKAAKDGQIRRFTGNDYLKDLPKGDSWLVFGWSGDAVQLESDNNNIKFLQPQEGFMLWTDNMQIPVGAPHAYTAEVFMNYVYDPEVQAKITAYVNYVPPVKGVQEIIRRTDPKLAESPLVFPDAETQKRARIFRPLTPDEENQLNTAFQKVIGA